MKYIVMALAVLLCGCVSVKLNGGEQKTTIVDAPPLGTIVTAHVGDHLLQKGEMVEETVLEVAALIDGAAYDIPAGTYSHIGYDEKYDFFSSAGVIAGPFIDPHQALSVDKPNATQLCVITILGAPNCYKGKFEKKKKISARGSSFQQTLIYSGRIGDKINISYREFSNNLARPAFNNDVEYDLAASNIFGYKGAQIEVIKADNTSITYKVLRSFN
jgi:hypothetical protein